MKKLLLILIMLTGTASADPVTWTIDGIFDDGGQVLGSFVYDADTETFSEIMIETFGAIANVFNRPAEGFTSTRAPCFPIATIAPDGPIKLPKVSPKAT